MVPQANTALLLALFAARRGSPLGGEEQSLGTLQRCGEAFGREAAEALGGVWVVWFVKVLVMFLFFCKKALGPEELVKWGQKWKVLSRYHRWLRLFFLFAIFGYTVFLTHRQLFWEVL